MKQLLSGLFFFIPFHVLLAQPHEIHYEKVDEIETDEVRILIYDQHSQKTFTQFTARIYNKTNDFILIHREDVKFIFNWGEKHMMESVMFIEPKGDITRIFKVNGGEDYWQDKLRIEFGEFFRVNKQGTSTDANNFPIPPQTKSLMDGPFSITALKWNPSSKEAFAEYKIRYRGEGLGIISPNEIRIKLSSGTTVDNQETVNEPLYVTPNKMGIVRVLHKFGKGEANAKDGFEVVFSEALRESTTESFKVPGVDFIKR
ncbi:MAG: hypothetical protein GC178_15295 [Flavobacteriales bacterium]|nr:hypothetical protein [Flavobacteriales bacterium]